MTERTVISFGDSNYGLETPPKQSFIVPFRRDDHFVERKPILDRLRQSYSTPASRVALVGLGGVGKSQLAIEHAYRVRDAFLQENKAIWVFWVHASTRLRVEQGFRLIADAVRIPGRDQPETDILQLVYRWLQNEHNGRWLMVLDSADDVDVFYSIDRHETTTSAITEGQKALWTYLPQSSNGSILITTRNRDLAFRLTDHRNNSIIDVGPMDDTHALELLAKRLDSQFGDTDGKELVEALEYMPLAISQAAAYIQQRAPRTSVQSYLQEFRRSESKQSGLLNHDVGDLRRDMDASNSITTTWQISVDHIHSKRPSATELLSLMSFFDHQSIPEFLIRPVPQVPQNDGRGGASEHLDGATEEDVDRESVNLSGASNSIFEEDIKTLRDYCLIGVDETGDTFGMHRLVQLATRTWLDLHKETEKFKKRCITRIAEVFPLPQLSNWDTCDKLYPHAERAIHYKPAEKELLDEWALIMYKGGWYSRDQGKYSTAEMMMKKALNACKAQRGEEHGNTLSAMHALASTYIMQERHQEAESLQTQLVKISSRVLGPEHEYTLDYMNDLALTYANQARWEEAELLYSQVLEKRKKGSESDTLIYYKRNQWEKAELQFLQVIEKRKEVLGMSHPDTLISMSNLACTWYIEGHKQKAVKLMDECVQTYIRVLGLEHPTTRNTLLELQQWRDEEAID
ncbi:P-loop containing nucleoside triphosphate hydrolase protein [Xylaria venustula]|nr:P-loop containing nucleoside triphosphate hydrolase protein [Xylaria venustula]